MAISFPASPSQNDTYTYEGLTYTFVDGRWSANVAPVLTDTTGIRGARIVDNKGTTVEGGTNIVGTQTRELNTVEYDPDNIVSLSNNQFTIEPGEWIITFSAPGYQVYDHKAKLVDVTNSNTVVATGTTEFGTGDTPLTVHLVPMK